MMRTVCLLTGLLSVSAKHPSSKCVLDGSRAVDDLLDSAVYIWAATKRCDKKLPNTEQDPIRCTLNIASSIESVNSMINVILKAVQDCGELETEHAKCGMAAGELTRAFAGLTASTAGIVAKCPNKLNGMKPLLTYGGPSGTLANAGMSSTSSLHSAAESISSGMGSCIVNVKDTMKSLFKAIKRVMYVGKECKKGKAECAHESLKVVAGLSAIGEYLAGAIGKCTTDAGLAAKAECSQESLELIQSLHNVGRASISLHEHCDEEASRLYEIEDAEKKHGKDSSVFSFSLAALLPIAGVLGFAAGSRFYRRSQVQSYGEMQPMPEE